MNSKGSQVLLNGDTRRNETAAGIDNPVLIDDMGDSLSLPPTKQDRNKLEMNGDMVNLPGTPLDLMGMHKKSHPLFKDEMELNALGSIAGNNTDGDHPKAKDQVETLYFWDGKRRIDFVLAYDDEEDSRKADKRQIYERNLREEGLHLELEDKEHSQDGKTSFLKIHCPWKVLTRHAELMNLKMPIKNFSVGDMSDAQQLQESQGDFPQDNQSAIGSGALQPQDSSFLYTHLEHCRDDDNATSASQTPTLQHEIKYAETDAAVKAGQSKYKTEHGRNDSEFGDTRARHDGGGSVRTDREVGPCVSGNSASSTFKITSSVPKSKDNHVTDWWTLAVQSGMDETVVNKPRFPPWTGSDNSSGNGNKRNEQEESLKSKPLWPWKSPFDYNHTLIPPEPSFFMAGFSRDREDQFIIKDRESFFTSAQRSQIVWQILMRTKYDDLSRDKVGVNRLLSNGTYTAAFPLHEGMYDKDRSGRILNDRRLLYLEWSRAGKWYKKQPLWLVRRYFGDKIGLYFAWLGFYTKMLIPAAIMGALCFMYGLITMDTEANIPSQEICNKSGAGDFDMCPLCDKACPYWKLYSSCPLSKLTHTVDNPATVFFSIFMAFWATMFLEFWKRRQSVIGWEWDLNNVEDEEEPRPEFEAAVKTFRINPVTQNPEPYLPIWSKVGRVLAAGFGVLFMLVLVMSAVFGVIIYRISVVIVLYGTPDAFFQKYAKLITAGTAACINLITIMLLNKVYERIAVGLTNLERPRTNTEYEDSLTFKIFLFQFINFYSSLIYIAFFKGRFFVHPGDQESRESHILKMKNDMCDPAGCLYELCIQLAIIMVGKQFFNNFMELMLPKIMNWWRAWRSNNNDNSDRQSKIYTRWEQDYNLVAVDRMSLFEEYLEMVIQYGFVTLFVAAFPLAPLFALINNVAEIRLDAYKYVTQLRRPLAQRVQDIGAWYGILQGITYMAVVSNAFVISYTSDFIPRMVYKYGYSQNHDIRGYMENSLSIFLTANFSEEMRPTIPPGLNRTDPDICRYRAFRNPPEDEKPYDLSQQYWHVFAARLAFVVIFEHIVFALTGLVAYMIPDIPGDIKTQIQREKLLAKEALYDSEFLKLRKDKESHSSRGSSMMDLGGGLIHNGSTKSTNSLRPRSKSQVYRTDSDFRQ